MSAAHLATYQLLPLQFLESGQSAHVDELVGDAQHVQRMEELGMRPGTRIEMLQPGSPCIIRLAGSKLCFRESDLIQVLVRTGDAA